MDAAYLQKSVGPALAQAVANTAQNMPPDPIAYLAQQLRHIAKIENDKAHTADAIQIAKAAAKRKADAEAVRAIVAEKERARATKPPIQLDGAASADAVHHLLAEYAAAVCGGDAYVWVSDLPDKVYEPPPPPSPEPEPTLGAEEGAAEGAPAAEGAEQGAPPTEEPKAAEDEAAPAEAASEEAPPPAAVPKVRPTALECVAAAGPEFMIGQRLSRVLAADAEGDDEPPPPVETDAVTFDAVDARLRGGAKTLHVPSAVQNRRLKFFKVPRAGGWLATVIEDVDGNVPGVLAVDLLSRGVTFSAGQIEQIEAAAAVAASRIDELAAELGSAAAAASLELAAAYEESRPGRTAELEAANGGDAPDPMVAAVCKAAHAVADMSLTDGVPLILKHLISRRRAPATFELALRAAYALLGTPLQKGWFGLRRMLEGGYVAPGCDDLVAAIGDNAPTDEGVATADAMLGDVDEAASSALKADCLLGFMLLTWVRESSELYKLKKTRAAEEAAKAAEEAAKAAEEAAKAAEEEAAAKAAEEEAAVTAAAETAAEEPKEE